MTLEIQVLAWDMYKNVMGLNRLMWCQLYPLDNWISNVNTCINQTIKNLHRFASTQKWMTI